LISSEYLTFKIHIEEASISRPHMMSTNTIAPRKRLDMPVRRVKTELYTALSFIYGVGKETHRSTETPVMRERDALDVTNSPVPWRASTWSPPPSCIVRMDAPLKIDEVVPIS
jgi:hypothetical protein